MLQATRNEKYVASDPSPIYFASDSDRVSIDLAVTRVILQLAANSSIGTAILDSAGDRLLDFVFSMPRAWNSTGGVLVCPALSHS
jgi:hypothetical protein